MKKEVGEGEKAAKKGRKEGKSKQVQDQLRSWPKLPRIKKRVFAKEKDPWVNIFTS